MIFFIRLAKPVLTRVFDIRPGEFRRSILLQINIFIIISIILILKSVVNALFLSKFGVQNLPFVFILIAVFAALLTFLYSKGLRSRPLISIIRFTYVITIFGLFLFATLLWLNLLESWVLYLFFIGVSLFAVLSASQFWILSNLVLNAREAKRLFGFIGAGAIAGGIFGGYLTSLVAELFGSINLIFLCALGLSICIPIYNRLWHDYVTEQNTSFQLKEKTKVISDHPGKLLLSSKHLSLLAAIVGVSVIVAKLIDYQFSALATQSIEDPDELAVFFGFWFSTMNVISFIIQLFLTKRIVGVYGVGFSLFILPIAILVPAVLLVFIPHLSVAIILKLNEGSLKQSLNKSGIELLTLPVPSEIKKQTKTFIDVFVDSVGTGIGGLLLLIFATIMDLPIEFISIITVALVLLWFYLVWSVKKEYIHSFKQKITKNENNKSLDLSQKSIIGGLRELLEKGSDSQIIYVLGKLNNFKHQSFVPYLKILLTHPNSQIRAETIRQLYFYKVYHFNDQIKTMINDIDSEVRIAAFQYILEYSNENIIQIVQQLLKSSDYRLRSAAILSVAMEIKDNPTLVSMVSLHDVIQNAIGNLPQIIEPKQKEIETTAYLKSAAYLGITKFYPWIKANMQNENENISIIAIESAGITTNIEFLPPLLDILVSGKYQKEASTALATYGISVLDEFNSYLVNDSTLNEYRNICLVLENLNSQLSVNTLLDILIRGDVQTRNTALRSLNSIRIKYSHLTFDKSKVLNLIFDEAKNYHDTLLTLYIQNEKISVSDTSQTDARNSLIDLLERRMDGNLERIFYLLGLRYSPEDIQSIYDGIQSNKPDLRTNAIEFLDNILDIKLKKILMPLVESTLLENISKDAISILKLEIPNQFECFQRLLEGNDLKVKLAVLYLMKVINEEKYAKLAKLYLNDKNNKIRHFASAVIESYNHKS